MIITRKAIHEFTSMLGQYFGDLQCPDGSTVHLDKDKAEILN